MSSANEKKIIRNQEKVCFSKKLYKKTNYNTGYYQFREALAEKVGFIGVT